MDLCSSKFIKLQEGTFRTEKLKKKKSEKGSDILGNRTC